jgi:hypothetical protein
MTPRGGGIVASVLFIVLLATGSYLLDVPMEVVLIGAGFAIAVILWIGSRTRPPEPR